MIRSFNSTITGFGKVLVKAFFEVTACDRQTVHKIGNFLNDLWDKWLQRRILKNAWNLLFLGIEHEKSVWKRSRSIKTHARQKYWIWIFVNNFRVLKNISLRKLKNDFKKL